MAHTIRPYTNDIARRMFFDTADLNYIGARAAYFEDRNWDFWWSTLHAAEKYLKCLLLMNGQSAKSGGHDLVKLLAKVTALDARLVPPPFAKPKMAGVDHWSPSVSAGFVTRLNELGSASNRCGTYGYSIRLQDLLCADQLIFWARRHARPLTWTRPGGQDWDWIEALANSPRDWLQRTGPLEAIAKLPAHDPRRWPLTRMNAAFFPKLRHRPRPWRIAANNPPIAAWAMRLEKAPPGSDSHRTAHAVIQWVVDTIQLTKDDRLELEALLAAHPPS